MIEEGLVKLDFKAPDKVTKKLDIFYNPVMKLNRDISINILKIAFKESKRPLRIGLPLSGSGIRGLRFLKEIPKTIHEIYFNDYAKKFPHKLEKLFELNSVEKSNTIYISNKDANVFLYESKGFDYIDIDPFGTPNPFLESAVQRIARNGILAVTATDTSALAGTYPKVCKRNYDAKPLRNSLMHYVGLRILARKVQVIGAQNEKALIPIFSYSKDHYYRIFFKCIKSKKRCDDIIKNHKYLLFCSSCFNYEMSDFNKGTCSCGNEFDNYCGKMFAGKMWSEEFRDVFDMVKYLSNEAIICGKLFDIHALCEKKKYNIASYDVLKSKLLSAGYNFSRTHFNMHAIKTNAPVEVLDNILSKND